MKKLLAFLLVAGFLTLLGLRLYEELGSKAASSSAGNFVGMRPTLLVELEKATLHQFTTVFEVLGELQPKASVDVMSRISGHLQQVLVERGDEIRAGQLLAVVDDADLGQQIRHAEASISVARAGVSRDQAVHDNLRIQVERYQSLHSEALVSTQDLEELQSRLRSARATVELAESQVRQAEATLQELKIQQEQTRMYSPLSGVVGQRYLDPGALVNPNTPTVSVLDLSRLKTVVPVTENILPQVRVGLRALVSIDALGGEAVSGTVTRISPYLSPDTRTADVEIEIANPNRRLRPGMFARVRIDADLSYTSVSIPRSALLTRGDQKGVFLLTDDLTTVFHPIEVGRIEDRIVEVLSGLEAGAEVVTAGAQSLNEGDRVRLE